MANELERDRRSGVELFLLNDGKDQPSRYLRLQQLRRAVLAHLPSRWFELHELGDTEFEVGLDHYMLERVAGPPVGSFHLWHEGGDVFVESLPESSDSGASPQWKSRFPSIAIAVQEIGNALDAQFHRWSLPSPLPKTGPQDDVLIELRPDLIRARISPSCRNVLGYEPDDLVGGHPCDVVHPRDWPHIKSLLVMSRRTGRTVSDIHRIRRRDGKYIWVQGHYTPYPDGGYAILLHDLTREWLVKQGQAGPI